MSRPAGRCSRRQLLRGLAAAGLATLVPGCGQPLPPLVIAASIWMGYEPLFLAKRRGWLDPEQVRLVELPSNSTSLRGLEAGIIQGAALTLDETLRACHRGIPLGVVLVTNVSAGADMLLVRPEIERLEQLAGRRVGVEQGSNAGLLLTKALEQVGLDIAAVTLVPLLINDHLRVWQQQQVDALVTYDPAASQLRGLGARRLFDSSQIPDTIIDVIALHRNVLTPVYRPAIQRLIGAHFQALDQLQRQPEATAAEMAGHLGLDQAQVLPAFAGLRLPDRADNWRLLNGPPPALVASLENISDFLRQSGLNLAQVGWDDLLQGGYLPPVGDRP